MNFKAFHKDIYKWLKRNLLFSRSNIMNQECLNFFYPQWILQKNSLNFAKCLFSQHQKQVGLTKSVSIRFCSFLNILGLLIEVYLYLQYLQWKVSLTTAQDGIRWSLRSLSNQANFLIDFGRCQNEFECLKLFPICLQHLLHQFLWFILTGHLWTVNIIEWQHLDYNTWYFSF